MKWTRVTLPCYEVDEGYLTRMPDPVHWRTVKYDLQRDTDDIYTPLSHNSTSFPVLFYHRQDGRGEGGEGEASQLVPHS